MHVADTDLARYGHVAGVRCVRVVQVDPEEVVVENKEKEVTRVPYGACVWATGVAKNPLIKQLQVGALLCSRSGNRLVLRLTVPTPALVIAAGFCFSLWQLAAAAAAADQWRWQLLPVVVGCCSCCLVGVVF